MEYGILKVGDTVKYSDEAKKELNKFSDNKLHLVTKIKVSDGLDDVDPDYDNTGDEWAELDYDSGADVYWLELVKRGDEE